MKLIGSLTSPYVRKVRIVLAEKKIEYSFETDSSKCPADRVQSVNPLGKIPVLIPDENTAIFDSRVIVEYLDNAAPNNKLMPAPNRERTLVKRWEALADGVCDVATAAYRETCRPARQQSAAWIKEQRATIARSLDFMDAELGDNPFFMGTHISLADLAVGTALSYLAFRFADIAWQEEHPNIARLYEKLLQRPSFSETAFQE